MLAIIAILTWSRYRIASRYNLQLQQKQQRIEEAKRELEKSNQELNYFTRAVSHDMKEPIRAMGNFSGLVLRRSRNLLDQRGVESLEFIKAAAQRVFHMLRDLEMYAGLRSMEEPPRPVDLNQVVRRALTDLGSRIEHSQARIEVDPLPAVIGYETPLYQIFLNLLGNSIKFSGGKPPRIQIQSEVDQDKMVARLTIRDQGIGISEKYHQIIFQAFERLHDRNQYEGSGLGLAIVRRAVELCQGRIDLHSEEGKGTSFFLIFRYASVNHPLPQPFAAD